MKIIEFLAGLSEQGIHLWVENDRLRFRAPPDTLTDAVKAEIVRQRDAIIQFLRQADQPPQAAAMQIPVVPRTERLPLSFAQERLWFLEQWQPGNATYHIPLLMRLHGRLDRSALQASIAAVIQRHESLRTTFGLDVTLGQPMQIIHADLPVALSYHDLRAVEPAQREAQALQVVTEAAQRPFDLASGPLTHVALVQLDETEHLLLVVMHHIITDGWSMHILTQEVGACYQAALSGIQPQLPALPVQYADFAVWQRERLQGSELEQKLAYWQQQLRDAPTLIDLPTDRPRPPVQTFRGASQEFVLSPALTTALQTLSQRQDATLFMTLLTGFTSLLARYTGQADVVVGSPIANRTHPAIEGVIGFFVNMLVLRADLRDNPRLVDALARVRATCLQAYQHQDTPFERLVELLQPARSMSYHPLVQAVFVLQNTPDAVIELPNLVLTPVGLADQTAKFDLLLGMYEQGGQLHGSVEYNVDLFDADTIARFIQRFQAVLAALADDPTQRVAELPLLSEAERTQLLVDWNATSVSYPGEPSLHTQFEAQVARTPDAIALSFEQTRLTYQELNQRANQLAHHLRGHGVGPEMLVGVCMERSLELVVALLGILKAGASYVPFDPEYPPDRLQFMLDDAAVAVLLTQQHLLASLPAPRATLICLDRDWPTIAQEPSVNPAVATLPDQLAYMIYTSGSTGKPKGALNTHRAICNRLWWMQATYGLTADDRVLQKTPFSFDVSVWEFFWPLMTGAHLVMARPGGHRDSAYLVQTIVAEQITTLHFVPSMLQVFLADPAVATCVSLKRVICSGEALPAELQRLFFTHCAAELHNLYGPTEAAVDVTFWQCQPDSQSATVPIGRPVANTDLYIVDHAFQPVPVGVAGELLIGGVQLARGYHQRPALTAERFVPHPFSPVPGARLYRTGDLTRYLPDGTIEYLGRLDHQVKLRGFRIELGEIEAALVAQPAIRDAVVLVRSEAADPASARLVAYLIAQPDVKVPSTSELRAALSRTLPDYMLPAAFVALDAWPLTPNGKLDRRALPAPDTMRPELDAQFIAPATPAEQQLAAIWAQTLGLQQVGIHDNFFSLGGDSIRSVQVLTLARPHGLEFTIQDLFKHQTIAELLRHVQPGSTPAAEAEPVVPFALIDAADRARLPADIEDAYPLTALQSGMIFHSTADQATGVYHDVVSIHLRGQLEPDILRSAIDQLVAEHAILRTSFDLVHYDEALQLVHRAVTVPLSIIDLRALTEDAAAATISAWFDAERLHPFDWQQPPLLRIQLHRRTDETFQLSVSWHHAILDGWSLASLLTELLQRYMRLMSDPAAPAPAQPAIMFREYVALERRALASEQHRTYWQDKLQERSSMRLPRLPRAATDDLTGADVLRQHVPISSDVSSGLHQLAQRARVPLKSVLLAAHLRVLALIGGTSDILTGLVAHGRPEVAGSERMLGLFLNTLPFRLLLGGGSWLDLARMTFDAEREMQPFVHFPMAQIQRLVGGEPLFETTFNFTHFHVYRQIASISEIEVIDSVAFERTNFTFGADFNLELETNQITLRLDVDPAVLDADQLDAMVGYYGRVLAAMATAPDQPYHRFSPLSRSEHEQLVVTWNPTPAAADPGAACIHELFAAQVRRTPDRIALSAAEGELTYAELNEQADRLARRLRQLDVGPETLVALVMERSIEAVVAIMAVWKAGGGYVPISPDAPEQRLQFMLRDTRSVATLTTTRIAARLSGLPSVICVDAAPDQPVLDDRPLPASHPDQLAYVIYTSGSTGQPKGVMVAHRSVANLVRAINDHIPPGVAAPTRIGFSVPLVFDVSVQLLVQLCSGHTLVVIPPAASQNAEELLSLFQSTALDFFNCTPTQLRMLYVALQSRPMALPGMMHIGGEALDPELWQWIASEPTVDAANGYGPTECTVTASMAPITAAQPVPVIGRPLHNLQFYILDAQMEPLPVGVAGEIYIGGAGVTRGYLQRPALTAEKFVPDPFSGMTHQQPGARLYRSGDLARYLPDGNIEYLGRIDDQIKLRGYRIELQEIEAIVRQQPFVQDAAVLLREDTPGDQRLVAYMTATVSVDHPEPTARDEQLHTALAERLPAYMVPTAFVWLEALPLLPSGKVNRRSLPQPEQRRIERALTPPRTALEAQIAEVWSNVLGIASVGIDDNFFALGGHSLTAMRLMAHIEHQTGVSLPLASLLQGATIADLAAAIQQRQTAAPFEPLVAIQPAGLKPPFFCIHPAGGDVLCYRDLAMQLGDTQPFYALQAVGLYDEQVPDTTIEALAARYRTAIRVQQPEGPYYLGGWSLGGVVAFELARQLQAEGASIGALVLIDSQLVSMIDQAGSQLDLLAGFAEQIGLDLEQLAFLSITLERLPAEERLSYVLAELQQRDLLPADLSIDLLSERFRVFEAHAQALHHYQLRHLGGAMTLIQASERSSDARDSAPVWAGLVDDLTVHTTPGNHMTILRPPQVATLAGLLADSLAQALEPAAGIEQRSTL